MNILAESNGVLTGIVSVLTLALGFISKLLWDSWHKPGSDRYSKRSLDDHHEAIMAALHHQDNVNQRQHDALIDAMKELTRAITDLRIELARVKI